MFFKKNIIYGTKKEQEYGRIRSGHRFMKDFTQILLPHVVKQSVDSDALDGKVIFFEVSNLPIITVPGSEQSLKLIDTLLNGHDEIFDTKVTLLIEEKWERVLYVIKRNNYIYFFYMAMI